MSSDIVVACTLTTFKQTAPSCSSGTCDHISESEWLTWPMMLSPLWCILNSMHPTTLIDQAHRCSQWGCAGNFYRALSFGYLNGGCSNAGCTHSPSSPSHWFQKFYCTILRDCLTEVLLRLQYRPMGFLYYQHYCYSCVPSVQIITTSKMHSLPLFWCMQLCLWCSSAYGYWEWMLGNTMAWRNCWFVVLLKTH